MLDRDLPLIVLNDGRILLETDHELYDEAREALNRFAQLEKSPSHIHTYRITNVSLWNSASLHDMTGEDIIGELEKYSRYPLPEDLAAEICEITNRWGKLILRRPLADEEEFEGNLVLSSSDAEFLQEVVSNQNIKPFISEQHSEDIALIENTPVQRGLLKEALASSDYPVQDQIGTEAGDELDIDLVDKTMEGGNFEVRDYQKKAADQFLLEGEKGGGYGIIILPPGTGKTIVALETLSRLEEKALILCTGTDAVRQWIDELLAKTTLTEGEVGEYTGNKKEIRPVTVANYHIAIQSVTESLVENEEQKEIATHFELFNQFNWGLVVYDEVHRLPANVFRLTAELQAKRRLGMTATLIREDEKEDEVFSLVGPLRYRASWQEMEQQGWIAEAICREIKVSLSEQRLSSYNKAKPREKFRIASKNPRKLDVLIQILENKRPKDKILIISYYLDPLKRIAPEVDAPLICGEVPHDERKRIYQDFKQNKEKVLCVSNVANYAIDLPGANITIQISGTYGSRQEEAQRLGRLLRPKSGENIAQFYSLVTNNTREEYFARKRQRYLVEEGYNYAVQNEEEYI